MCREKDPDPEGKQLAATKDPLAEATKLVQQLKQYAGDRMKTHLLAFEVCPLLPCMMSCTICCPFEVGPLCKRDLLPCIMVAHTAKELHASSPSKTYEQTACVMCFSWFCLGHLCRLGISSKGKPVLGVLLLALLSAKLTVSAKLTHRSWCFCYHLLTDIVTSQTGQHARPQQMHPLQAVTRG